ncbi:MAG: glycosyltransferase family 2 protein [Phycisphaerae bacterium]|nr:glycosyltransferase family 2 protein [Phycisphaerae bacterium]MCZ2400830.1 glycosyltransferase family 2 protein [Phycisphaerae bacterium]NUQ48367.1 glycosyltransferase family 2 protein [Phycisphaerae bacterium]
MSVRPDISVVVPMFNEEANVANVLARFLESLARQRRSFEIVVVNDGSRDRTGELLDAVAAREPRLRVIHLARNFGQTAAMMAGFWAARAPVIVPLDGDGQNEPDEIERLVDKLEEGYDVVSGWRKDRKDSWLRTRVSRVANWLIGRVTGVRLHDYGCTLKAYRADVVRDARLFGEMHRFIPIYASIHGARITEMVVRHNPRTAGRSKYGYGRVTKVLFDLLLVRLLQKYRTRPIHFFGQITMWAWAATVACFGFALLSAVYSLDPWKAFWGKAPLIGTIFFVLGFIAIMAGLVAELVMRAGFEFNAGRYWDEARRVNFGPVGDTREREPHTMSAAALAAEPDPDDSRPRTR